MTFINVTKGKTIKMVIAVINTKGGTGKTTSSVFIAHGLSGHGKTLLIDADPQGSSMSWSKTVGREAFLPSTIPLAVSDLNERLPDLAEGFAHVLIDTPPGEGSEQQAPITESAIRAAERSYPTACTNYNGFRQTGAND